MLFRYRPLGEKAAALLPAVERAMKDSGDNYIDRAGAHVLETLGNSNSASSRVQE